MHVAILDFGTGGIHAAVFDEDGNTLTHGYEIVTYKTDPLGRTMEFDADALLGAGMKLLGKTIARVPGGREDEMILAITSQRHGCVFLDRQMKPVLSVANLDNRVDRQTLDGVLQRKDEIYDVCARLPLEIFPAVRLLWLSRHDREVRSRITSFLMMNEYFAFRLTGTPCAERTSVSESMLYDIRNGGWSDRLAEIFGCEDLDRWPVVEPGTVIGTIRDEYAEIYELPLNTRISLAAGDTQCAAVGCRAFEAGDVVVVNGSTTPVVGVTGELIFDPLRRTWADHYLDDRYLIESNAGRTGTEYRALTHGLSRSEDTEPDEQAVFEAEELGASAILVPNPREPVKFNGNPSEVRFSAEQARVLELLPYLMIENTGFAIVAHIEELERVSGTAANRVVLTGGSSRSLWTRRILSVLLRDSPVYLTSHLDTTSRGAAMLAVAGAGYSSAEDAFGEGGSPEDTVVLLENSVGADVVELIRRRYRRWNDRFTEICEDS